MELPALQQSFNGADLLPLEQNWQSATQRDFQPGAVQVAWCPDYLHILVDLIDEDIVVLGPTVQTSSLVVADIFLVFIDRPESNDYLELHVTPDAQLRAIAWTPERLRRFRDGNLSIDEITAENGHTLYAETWTKEKSGAWQAYLRVPGPLIAPSSCSFRKDASIKATFCRFDAAPDSVAPVLSSTSSFANGPKFHDSKFWHEIVLRDA